MEMDSRVIFIISVIFGILDFTIQDELEDEGSKVVGGKPATKGQFPYQVGLTIKSNEGTFLCGGSMISSKWVLTAAHCCSGRLEEIRIRVGYLDLKNLTGGEYDRKANIEKVKVHPGYTANSRAPDLCLVGTDEQFKESDTSRSVKLIDTTEHPTGIPAGLAISSGWGTLSEGGRPTSQLMYVELPILDNSKCIEAYGNTFKATSMICAGYMEGGKDTCQGDSGGPLVMKSTNELIGVVSWGMGCARPNFPGVYAWVAPFLEWVRKNSQD